VSLQFSIQCCVGLLFLQVTSLGSSESSNEAELAPPEKRAILPGAHSSEAPAGRPEGPPRFRGIHFNPQFKPGIEAANPPWLLFYSEYRREVQTALQDLASKLGLNLVDIFVPIPHTLRVPQQAPETGQRVDQWANKAYLDNVAAFVDDCYDANLSVELDLACNMWVPYSIETTAHIANKGHWPIPDDTPWDESATWYRGVIEYVESHTTHPESIALWCMMGNHALGNAEPCLWDREDNPAFAAYTERFVKEVWPVFRSAGRRPKAGPIMMPVFSADPYWMKKTSEQRLSGFSNLKKWLIDDLALPPDYWVMSTYPLCDPGPDGFHYLSAIARILGPESMTRMISTDLKWHNWDGGGLYTSIIPTVDHAGVELLEWNFRKVSEYGMAGWWVWSYQDTSKDSWGIRTVNGDWKGDLMQCIRKQAPIE